jgi:hypothetical protein
VNGRHITINSWKRGFFTSNLSLRRVVKNNTHTPPPRGG